MNIENEDSLTSALSTGINLFLGAGFSVHASDANGEPLPTGGKLAAELTAHFSLPEMGDLDLSHLVAVLETTHRADLTTFLTQRFTVATFDGRYRVLDRLAVKSVVTTNIDNLIERIFSSGAEHYLSDLETTGPALNPIAAVSLLHLHGSVLRPNQGFTFSPSDLASAFASDPDRFHALTGRLQTCPTLFWGYGLRDSGVLQAINPRTIRGRDKQPIWCVIPPSAATNSHVAYLHALSFNVIVASTDQMLDWLASRAPVALSNTGARSGLESDPYVSRYRIPPAGSLPVRPARDFYLGAAPSWYDVYHSHMPKLRHLASVMNAVQSKRHTNIDRLPESGKTTLMMQLAASLTTSQLKLVGDLMTHEEAVLLATRLNGTPTVIFFDNLADSLNAISFLATQPNIQLCCFDRAYDYEVAAQKLLFPRDVLDMSDLSDQDAQAVLESIPAEICRRHRAIPPRGHRDAAPTVFEIIDANVNAGKLQERFRGVLDDLARHGKEYIDFLLVCCYVHRSRTPVSMDMLTAYFRGIADYRRIYEIRQSLGVMLRDYHELVQTADQDLYFPRSAIIAEAVLRQCRPQDLARVLTRFQSEVSPYRIYRYDVFRRSAYDNEIAIHAFPAWPDGMAFYQRGFDIDQSYYMKQQGALYLSKKKRYTEAFEWIHEALRASGNRIFSIRNSYAVILFNANIDHEDTSEGTVRKTLLESMQILQDCVNDDRRSAYHVTTFAEQARRFYERYGDDESVRLIEKAREWAKRELEREVWNGRLKRALSKLNELPI